MTRQTNRIPEPDRKQENLKRDAAYSPLRVSSNREPQINLYKQREVRDISRNRFYMNDLYERSSI